MAEQSTCLPYPFWNVCYTSGKFPHDQMFARFEIEITLILMFSGRNLAWRVKHLRRDPCEKFKPVIVNPWIPGNVPSNRKNGPWIPGDRHQAIEINDDAEDAVNTDEQAMVVDQDDDDAEEDFTSPDGEGIQLNDSLQDVDKDNDATLTTQQGTEEQNAALLLSTAAAETAQDTTLPSIDDDDDDVAMQDALEQDDSAEDSDTHSNTEHEKTTRSTSLANEEEHDPADDDPARNLWCICNGEDNGTPMILCDNADDPNCKGKWYHRTCVDMGGQSTEKIDWYCRDCRKKLKLGVYSNGCVAQGRKQGRTQGKTLGRKR
jgi:hypothetical protein